jgi:hypothetical protein
MGDRANVKMIYGDGPEGECGPVYFYTHWGGSELPETVQTALRKRWRWDDESYLARIIFCEVVGDGEWKHETGFGVSPYEYDLENPTVEVDCPNQMIRIEGREWTFEEFCGTDLGRCAE